MPRTTKTVDYPANAAALWNAQLPPIAIATQSYNVWLEQTTRVRDEALRFAQERFNKGLEVAAQLADCRDLAAAFALHAEFASNAAADFLQESQKMIELMSHLAQESFANLQQSAEGSQAS